MVDIDGDGLVDGEAVDMDENGVLDTFIEKDEDRNLEFWHEDKNGNGVIERMIVHARNDKVRCMLSYTMMKMKMANLIQGVLIMTMMGKWILKKKYS